MDSFFVLSQKQQSLSCGDIAALATGTAEHDQSYVKQLQLQRRNSKSASLQRFWKATSSLVHSTTAVDRAKTLLSTRPSSSSCDLADDIDCQFTRIKNELAKFREQDVKFRERMDSLSTSIDELVSQSGCSTPSDISTASSSASDPIMSSDDDSNEVYKDDHIEHAIKNNVISMSFSSEMLNCIPTIALTYYNGRQLSDPTIHGKVKPEDMTSLATHHHQRTYSTDQVYFYSQQTWYAVAIRHAEGTSLVMMSQLIYVQHMQP